MDLNLHGKRALVTGSSSGIGEAIAKALAREGASVVVHGRKEGEAKRVAETIRKGGSPVAVALGDLATDEGARRVAEVAGDAFDGIDIVVNNAGAFIEDNWSNLDTALWLELYNRNAVSMVRMVRHFIAPMKERKWGRFIQIASCVATNPMPNAAAYAASKAAVVNLTVSLAKELAGTMATANSISPGVILTPEVERSMQEVAKKEGWSGPPDEIERRFLSLFGQMPPTGRLGRVEEVADLATFLASPCADYINGADLRVDGGLVPTIN